MPKSEVNTIEHNHSVSTSLEGQKARMLISLLGADFAKSSNHSFFEKLASVAVKTNNDTSQKIDVKKSLRDLIDAIDNTNAQTNKKKPDSKVDIQPEKFAVGGALNKILSDTEILQQQHPVLIAAYLRTSPKTTKSTILKQLSGATARQVAMHLGLFTRAENHKG